MIMIIIIFFLKKKFAQAGFHKLLMENINLAKYKTPTPVQRYGIAVINAGRDLMACAQTGIYFFSLLLSFFLSFFLITLLFQKRFWKNCRIFIPNFICSP